MCASNSRVFVLGKRRYSLEQFGIMLTRHREELEFMCVCVCACVKYIQNSRTNFSGNVEEEGIRQWAMLW